jgi:broad specificity phosphatase PhoE
MTDLWLVRHGQTDWNLVGKWQGQSQDAPSLNDVGRAQVLGLRDELKGIHFSALYSSDLPRARQTAELLSSSLCVGVHLEPCLREMNLGDWEGMCSDDIKAAYPRELEQRAHHPSTAPAPGGESPSQVASRVIAAVNEIAQRHHDENILIVAHGISLAIITCFAQGIPLEKVYDYVPANARLHHVEWKISKPITGSTQRGYSGNLSSWVSEKA